MKIVKSHMVIKAVSLIILSWFALQVVYLVLQMSSPNSKPPATQGATMDIAPYRMPC